MPISVVIPAYRAAHTIQRAVDSVLQQTLSAAEILVIDDGSPDGTELITALRPYGSAVTLLHKENGGAASARNFGIAHARGQWIAFLDADDYWEPEKLALQRAVADAHPQVQIIGCRWYKQEPGAERFPDPAPTARFTGRLLRLQGPEAFHAALAIATGSLMIRRAVLADQPFLSELEPAEDRDLWFRLLKDHPAYLLPEFLATYVQEPGGISRVNADRDCASMLAVIQRHASSIGSKAARQQTSVVYRRWAARHLAAGKPARALPPAFRRLRLQPLSMQAWWVALKSSTLSLRDMAFCRIADPNSLRPQTTPANHIVRTN